MESSKKNTLRRPMTVIKKRSGPLDDVLVEVNRLEGTIMPQTVSQANNESNYTGAGNTQETSNDCVAEIERELSVNSRRRSQVRDKDRDKEKKRERWLLTRKTWRYMTDAGRKLIPDGLHHGSENIPIIEAQFQRVCASEPRFILWRRKTSFPGASKGCRRRIKLLPRNRNNQPTASSLVQIQCESENIDHTIELLQTYLKIHEPYKTTALLGTKTIRPDQTMSPSSRRPLISNSPTSNELELRDKNCVSQLMECLNILCKNSTLNGLEMVDITPSVLEDKAYLRKVYNMLKKQQLHRLLHSSEPKRSGFGRAASFSNLFSYTSSSSKRRDIPKNDLVSKNIKSLLKSDTQTALTATLKRQKQPPNSLEFICNANRITCDLNAIIRKPTAIIEKNFNSCGTQTSFIQLGELKQIASQYEYMLENSNNLAVAEDPEKNANRRKSSIDNEDVSQSVSDTIKRYLRMARKKSVHDGDANRFKSVNYDRNLRNIKAKGEINPPGMDEYNNKAAQTLDAWALIALDHIRGNEYSNILENAHLDWQRDLDERLKKKIEWEKMIKNVDTNSRHNDSIDAIRSKKDTEYSCTASAPTSPTNVVNYAPKEKAVRTASALLSSGSQFFSNLLHANLPESSSNPNLKNDKISDVCTTFKNETTNMQKSKSLSNVGQFVSRKIWGSRTKCQSRQSLSQEFMPPSHKWTPSDNCTWVSEHGETLHLADTSLEKLSDTEAEILTHIALKKIKELNIGSDIELTTKSNKRKIIPKKRALTTGFFDIGLNDYMYIPFLAQAA
ncbi:uncharacterized protein LOC117134976 [Drosophila busckii]|uniref:uncharacterized protein LOC117134976 n=1 Tax=Drosophila busckii TaxID=30019 RepID=UPI0014333A26|nr:uncharacterized protein LOC117134976 [Drosophila busckii]